MAVAVAVAVSVAVAVVVRIVKSVVLVTKETSAIIFGKAIRAKLCEKWVDKVFLRQPKVNLQSFKSTPHSRKQHLKALERKRSLGAADLIDWPV